jgi:hypothetical protein
MWEHLVNTLGKSERVAEVAAIKSWLTMYWRGEYHGRID